MLFFIGALGVFGLIFYAYLIYFEKEALKRLDIKVTPDFQRTKINETIDLTVTLTNARRLILPIVRMTLTVPESFHFDDETESYFKNKLIKTTATLFSYQRSHSYFKFTPSKRGYFEIRLQLTCVDILGIKHVSLDHDLVIPIIVHPNIDELEETLINSSLMGNRSIHRFIHPDPLFFNGIRPYQSYDDQKDIDWKATAKTQSLQVKKYEYTTDSHLAIYLCMPQLTKINKQDENFMEQAVSFAASLVHQSYLNQSDFTFYTNGFGKVHHDYFKKYASSYLKTCAYLDEIACVNLNNPMEIKDLLDQTLTIKRDQHYLFIAYKDEDIDDKYLLPLIQRGIRVTMVVYEGIVSKPCSHLFLKKGDSYE